jgi:hypothetical protein
MLPAAREAALKEREIELKGREIELKAKELRSGWTSSAVLGLLAASIGLAGNIAVALLNARATLSLERYKARASLITEICEDRQQRGSVDEFEVFRGQRTYRRSRWLSP